MTAIYKLGILHGSSGRPWTRTLRLAWTVGKLAGPGPTHCQVTVLRSECDDNPSLCFHAVTVIMPSESVPSAGPGLWPGMCQWENSESQALRVRRVLPSSDDRSVRK
jgi:hypothetical protein